MFIGRAYRINTKTGEISTIPSVVSFDKSEKKLRRKLEKLAGVKKVTIAVLPPDMEPFVQEMAELPNRGRAINL